MKGRHVAHDGRPAVSDPTSLERTAGLFDELAELFDGFTRNLESGDSPITAWLKENLPGGDRALDVGCGAGRYSFLLADQYAHVLGIDPAENMVRIARRTPGPANVEFAQRSAIAVTPATDGTFDLVFAFSSVFHMGPAEVVLPHLRSLVAPGGLLVVFEPERPPGYGTEGWQVSFAFAAAQTAYQVTGRIDSAVDALRLFTDPRWISISELSRPPSYEEFRQQYTTLLPGVVIERDVYPGSFTASWRAPEAPGDAGAQSAAGPPNQARVYDWLLGGDQSGPVDREFGRRLTDIVPEAQAYARENRAFLTRGVRAALEAGVRQFVDVGSGLPTQGNVHEVAAGPGTRVVYVDHDPEVVDHANRLLAERGDPARHRAVVADLANAGALWQRVLDTGLIDPAEPVCLSLVAWLHFVTDEQQPGAQLAYLRERLCPGSVLVLSHTTAEGEAEPTIEQQAAEVHRTDQPGQLRGRAEFAAFFDGFELVEPGVTWAPLWQAEAGVETPFTGDPVGSHTLAAVGRKR
nr:methyltransferase [uncultured bacterium]